jgi:hypothetical protein
MNCLALIAPVDRHHEVAGGDRVFHLELTLLLLEAQPMDFAPNWLTIEACPVRTAVRTVTPPDDCGQSIDLGSPQATADSGGAPLDTGGVVAAASRADRGNW